VHASYGVSRSVPAPFPAPPPAVPAPAPVAMALRTTTVIPVVVMVITAAGRPDTHGEDVTDQHANPLRSTHPTLRVSLPEPLPLASPAMIWTYRLPASVLRSNVPPRASILNFICRAR